MTTPPAQSHHPASSSLKSLPPTPSSSSDPPSSDTANVKRSRSIQFLPTQSSSKAPMSGPWTAEQDMGEGPMGETTPIISSERGGGRDYRAFESLGPPAEEDEDRTKNGSTVTGAGPRRRKMSAHSTASWRRSVNEEEADGNVVGWWRAFLEKYGSVELDNKGSVARDHLALERTFLAWLRTSLAFASIGIAITQLFRLNTTISEREGLTPVPVDPGTIKLRQVGKPLGATFLGIAILVLIVGGRRYFESQYWIIRGKFPASRGSVCLITFVALALTVTSLVVV
ncbi:hypothetical protein MMC13_001365, partial [Lambiella insularis]|nr:hypothetical protein [Lambiella insularis]